MQQNIDIEFHIATSLDLFRITDLSLWGPIEDKPSIIEITTPGSSNAVKRYFDKHKTNVFNSMNLDVNCGNDGRYTLDDGIYIVRVTGSPSKFYKEHYYLKTDQVESEIAKIYIDIFSNPDANNEGTKLKLTEIEFQLQGARAFLKYEDVTMAGNIFEKVIEMVDKLKNCKSCR